MASKMILRARVRDGGKFSFRNVDIVNGQPVPLEGATSYYMRHVKDGKRIDEPLGNDLQKAFLSYMNRQLVITHEKLGLPSPVTLKPQRKKIDEAIDEFLEEKDVSSKTRGTLYVYRHALTEFAKVCRKTYLDEIERQDIIGYISWLKKNLIRHAVQGRVGGDRPVTIINRLRYLTVFFLKNGIRLTSVKGLPGLINKEDWPKATRKNPDRYSLEEHVQKLLKAATEDEKDLIHFFLCSGFRDQEAVHAAYKDIDFRRGTINVHDKPEYNFKVKDHEQRPVDIPLPGWFIERLRRRQERSKHELIFPQADGRPDHCLLQKVKNVGERAGLTCHVTLHKFRRTFCTLMAKQFGVRQAQAMLGHANITTTMKYLAADEMDTPEAHKGVEAVFSSVGD